MARAEMGGGKGAACVYVCSVCVCGAKGQNERSFKMCHVCKARNKKHMSNVCMHKAMSMHEGTDTSIGGGGRREVSEGKGGGAGKGTGPVPATGERERAKRREERRTPCMATTATVHPVQT